MTDAEAGESMLAQLLVTSDFLRAMDRLSEDHDPARVLACAREWVRYREHIESILLRQVVEVKGWGHV